MRLRQPSHWGRDNSRRSLGAESLRSGDGSGAFLVEACRQLATRLVEAWTRHQGTRPPIAEDEDEDLLARRLVRSAAFTVSIAIRWPLISRGYRFGLQHWRAIMGSRFSIMR